MRTTAILSALVMTLLPLAGCTSAEGDEGESTDQAFESTGSGFVMGRLDFSAAKVASVTKIVVPVGCPTLDGEVVTVHPQQEAGGSPVSPLRVAHPGRWEARLSDETRTGAPVTVVATDHVVWGYGDFVVDAKLSLTRR